MNTKVLIVLALCLLSVSTNAYKGKILWINTTTVDGDLALNVKVDAAGGNWSGSTCTNDPFPLWFKHGSVGYALDQANGIGSQPSSSWDEFHKQLFVTANLVRIESRFNTQTSLMMGALLSGATVELQCNGREIKNIYLLAE